MQMVREDRDSRDRKEQANQQDFAGNKPSGKCTKTEGDDENGGGGGERVTV